MLRSVDAGTLNIAFEETGSQDGWPALLLHGFPYDVRAYDAVTPILVSAACARPVPASKPASTAVTTDFLM